MTRFSLASEAERTSFGNRFPNLYLRIRRLYDYLLCYCKSGTFDKVVAANADASGVPAFVSVSFSEEEGEAYERTAEAFFSAPVRGRVSVPQPKFRVELCVKFADGTTDGYAYDFRHFSENSLLAFCAPIAERAAVVYRRSFGRR